MAPSARRKIRVDSRSRGDGLQARTPVRPSARRVVWISTSPSGDRGDGQRFLVLGRKRLGPRCRAGRSATPTVHQRRRDHEDDQQAQHDRSTKGVTLISDIGRSPARRLRPRRRVPAALGDGKRPSVKLPRQEGGRTRRQSLTRPPTRLSASGAELCCRVSRPGSPPAGPGRWPAVPRDAGGHDGQRGVAGNRDLLETTA